jgi:hypothetical protein
MQVIQLTKPKVVKLVLGAEWSEDGPVRGSTNDDESTHHWKVCCGGVDVLVLVDGTNLQDVLGSAHSLAR